MATLMTGFDMPASSGLVDVPGFFPGMTVRMDSWLTPFLIGIPGGYYNTPPLGCLVYQASTHDKNDVYMLRMYNGRHTLDAHKFCALLSYLGAEGFPILQVPEGKNETSVVLGYLTDHLGRITSVVFVEHENGIVGEIHIHARSLNLWNHEDNLWVLVSSYG